MWAHSFLNLYSLNDFDEEIQCRHKDSRFVDNTK